MKKGLVNLFLGTKNSGRSNPVGDPSTVIVDQGLTPRLYIVMPQSDYCSSARYVYKTERKRNGLYDPAAALDDDFRLGASSPVYQHAWQ